MIGAKLIAGRASLWPPRVLQRTLYVLVVTSLVAACSSHKAAVYLPRLPQMAAMELHGDEGGDEDSSEPVACEGDDTSLLKVVTHDAHFPALDSEPFFQHYCLYDDTDPLCNGDWSSLPKQCGNEADLASEFSELDVRLKWLVLESEGRRYPVLGTSTFSSSSFRTGHFPPRSLLRCDSFAAMRDRLERVNVRDLVGVDGNVIRESDAERRQCPGPDDAIVSYLEQTDDSVQIRPGIWKCVIRDGVSYYEVISISAETDEAEVVFRQEINSSIRGAGWVFSPPVSGAGAQNSWAIYHSPRTLAVSRTGEYELHSGNFVASSKQSKSVGKSKVSPFTLGKSKLSDASVPSLPYSSTRTVSSALWQSMDVAFLIDASGGLLFSSRAIKPFPRRELTLFLKEPKGSNSTRACITLDNNCDRQDSVRIGRDYYSLRYKHNDGTTVAHEVAHLAVHDIRYDRFQGMGIPPDRAASLRPIEDGADSFAMSFTFDSCIGRWATGGICVREIADQNKIPAGYPGTDFHRNGAIVANMLRSAMNKSKQECGAVGYARHFAWLSRAAAVSEPVARKYLKNVPPDVEFLRTARGLLSAYYDQAMNSPQSQYLSGLACEWYSEYGICADKTGACVC